MRAGLLAVFDQQFVEVRIGVDDGHLLGRYRKCDLIRIGAEDDIAAQERVQLGTTSFAAMNESDAARQQATIGQLPADADQRGNPSLDLMPIRQPLDADISEGHRKFFSPHADARKRLH